MRFHGRLRLVAAFVVFTLLLSVAIASPAADAAGEPYQSTAYIEPGLVTAADQSAFIGLTDEGQGLRRVFDRRVDDWVNINAHLFTITFSDGLSTTAIVNPEFGGIDAARVQAAKYGRYIGQLPSVMRVELAELWIHAGQGRFGGTNNAILLHTEQAERDEAAGFIEEVLLHEGVHAALDSRLEGSDGWREAQERDAAFISAYAAENPDREDLAESFVAYLLVRYFPGRIAPNDVATIARTIPNRIAFFDQQLLSLDRLNTATAGAATRTGDTNCDGRISIADAVMIAQYVVEIRFASSSCPLSDPATELATSAGDVNCTGTMTMADAVIIAQYSVGLRTATSVCPLADPDTQIHLRSVDN